jgi:OOP family OmpA-OmpF porin
MRYLAVLAGGFALAAVMVTIVHAQQRTSGWYAGGSLGQGRADVGGGTTTPTPGVSTSKDEKDTYYKLFGGYRFNRYFAAEGGYADFGKYSLDLTRAAPAGTAHVDVRASGWFLDALGVVPLGNNFSLFGKIGAVRTAVESNASASGSFTLSPGVSPNRKATETDWKWGIGAAYDFNAHLGARLEYELVKDVGDQASTGGSSDIKLWSLGVLYRF